MYVKYPYISKSRSATRKQFSGRFFENGGEKGRGVMEKTMLLSQFIRVLKSSIIAHGCYGLDTVFMDLKIVELSIPCIF